MAKNIHNAAGRGNIEKIQSFIDTGVSIDDRDENGLTPLFVAAYWNHNETVKWLHENGADILARTKHGKNLLMQAADGGNNEGVEYFLSEGVPVDEKDEGEATVLEFCAWHCNPETVSIVLNANTWNSEELYYAAYCAIGNSTPLEGEANGETRGCIIFELLYQYADQNNRKLLVKKELIDRANELNHKNIIPLLERYA